MKTKITGDTRVPTVVGAGLIALDAVVNVSSNDIPRYFAGGTCGNVLTILCYLGWKGVPVGRLGRGPVTKVLLADLAKWQVSTEFLSVKEDGSTPIIIERIVRSTKGEPYHTFSWRCPCCSAYLPGYKPILGSAALAFSERLPKSQVFFFDRASRGVLNLAEANMKNGALVVFEPSGVGDPKLFREAWGLAHVVKYSHERLRDIADLELKRSESEGLLLEVETLGRDGLRYRSQLSKAKTEGWRTLAAFRPGQFKDAAGSGDWCTAAILHRLGQKGLRGFRSTSAARLDDALRYGQALASWNCGFEGARGGMYQVDKSTFESQVETILGGGEAFAAASNGKLVSSTQLLAGFCPACKNKRHQGS